MFPQFDYNAQLQHVTECYNQLQHVAAVAKYYFFVICGNFV